MPSVFLIATLDTKGVEAAFIKGLLGSWGVPVTLVDAGAIGLPAVEADIPRERLFELAGVPLADGPGARRPRRSGDDGCRRRRAAHQDGARER